MMMLGNKAGVSPSPALPQKLMMQRLCEGERGFRRLGNERGMYVVRTEESIVGKFVKE